MNSPYLNIAAFLVGLYLIEDNYLSKVTGLTGFIAGRYIYESLSYNCVSPRLYDFKFPSFYLGSAEADHSAS